jgi:hypothetical protein
LFPGYKTSSDICAQNLLSRYLFKRKLKRGLLPGDMNSIRLIISSCGSIAFAILSAYASATVVYKSCPPGVTCSSPGYGILVWATRPRGTAGVFFINAPFAAYGLAADFQKRKEILPSGDETLTESNQRPEASTTNNKRTIVPLPTQRAEELVEQPQPQGSQGKRLANPFLKTCLTTMITEAYINLIGVSIWSYPTIKNWGKDVMDSYWDTDRSFCVINLAGMLAPNASATSYGGYVEVALCSKPTDKKLIIASYGLWATCVPVAVIVALMSWIIVGSSLMELGTSLIESGLGGKDTRPRLRNSRKGRQERKEGNLDFFAGFFTCFSFMWIFVVLSFAFSWLMWSSFLDGTADKDYCVGSTSGLTIVYIVYPLLLAIWREIV